MEPQTTDVYVKLHKCTDFLLPEYIFNKQHYPTWSVLLTYAQPGGSSEKWCARMGGFWKASYLGVSNRVILALFGGRSWRKFQETYSER